MWILLPQEQHSLIGNFATILDLNKIMFEYLNVLNKSA